MNQFSQRRAAAQRAEQVLQTMANQEVLVGTRTGS